MKIPLLFCVVTLQVIAFQLIWARLNRRLPDLLIGNRDMPSNIAATIAEFRRNAGRGRIVLGVLYLLAAPLVAFLLPFDLHQRKIGLATVSLLSSATLLAGFFRDVAKIRRISSALPEPSTRVAGLKPRSISMAYPPVLEAVPILIALATIAGTIWALQQGVAAAGFHPWLRPAVQIFYILLTLGLSLFQVRTGACLTWRARSFQSSPEEAVALTDGLIRMEVLYLLICRVAMAVLLGIMQVRALRAAMGLPPLILLQIGEWAILIGLLGQLIVYLLRHPIRSTRNPAPLGEVHPGNGSAR
jgi:hypothetical protein